MPWKLIGFIALLVVFMVFSGLNVHKVQVNFGIFTISEIPVFITLIVSFVIGSIVTIPFMLISKNKAKKAVSRRTDKSVVSESKKTNEKEKTIADKVKDD